MTFLYVALDHALLVVKGRDDHWEASAHLEGLQLQCVAVDPDQPEQVYCGSFDRGLWRSADAGGHWEQVGMGIRHAAVTCVAVSPNERARGYGVVYVGTEPSALYRSADRGNTWEECPELAALPSSTSWSFPPRPHTHHARYIALDPVEAGRLYLCIEAGALLRSADSGRTWQDRTAEGPRDTHTLATHLLAPGRLYSAAGDGFTAPGRGYAESYDRGATWQHPDEGLRHHYLWGLAVDPADPDTIVASAAASPQAAHDPRYAAATVYRTAAGQPWQAVEGLPSAEGMLAPVLAANAAEPGVFYCAANMMLYRSADAGRHWQPLEVALPAGHRQLGRANGMAVGDKVAA